MAIVLWVIAIIQFLISGYLLLMGYVDDFEGLIGWAKLTVGGFLFVSGMIAIGFAAILSRLNSIITHIKSDSSQPSSGRIFTDKNRSSLPLETEKPHPPSNLPFPKTHKGKGTSLPPVLAGLTEASPIPPSPSLHANKPATGSEPFFSAPNPVDLDESPGIIQKTSDFAAEPEKNPFPWIKQDSSITASNPDPAPLAEDIKDLPDLGFPDISNDFNTSLNIEPASFTASLSSSLLSREEQNAPSAIPEVAKVSKENEKPESRRQLFPAERERSEPQSAPTDIAFSEPVDLDIVSSQKTEPLPPISAVDTASLSAPAPDAVSPDKPIEKADSSEPKPVKEPPAIQAPPVTITKERVVVGQHESGGSRYIMYDDNSIDAETPHGRFHFSSIEEMKAYIAQSSQSAPE